MGLRRDGGWVDKNKTLKNVILKKKKESEIKR